MSNYYKSEYNVINNSLICVIFTLFSLTFNTTAQTASNQKDLVSNNSTIKSENSAISYVDPTIIVNASGSITDFVVTINDCYLEGDILSYTGHLPSGITVNEFNPSTRSLVFCGYASTTDWQDLMRRVTLKKSSATSISIDRAVSFTGGNVFFKSIKRKIVSISFEI